MWVYYTIINSLHYWSSILLNSWWNPQFMWEWRVCIYGTPKVFNNFPIFRKSTNRILVNFLIYYQLYFKVSTLRNFGGITKFHNIFTTLIFWVVVGLDVIIFYFISFWFMMDWYLSLLGDFVTYDGLKKCNAFFLLEFKLRRMVRAHSFKLLWKL